ncbi:MAG: sigma-70 family RNA polymerase sigma factor [Tenericutes bacterium]|nr:sigma-70 family RNA polymerase sigma factor [Mycoplasmatota bacterium]
MEELLNYEGLVYGIIQRYTKYFEKDDLYQAGMVGLINAYHNFDSSQGTKFSTYAYYYVLGEVRKFVREAGLVKVSSDLVKLNQSIEKVREVMSQRLGREPTTTEISLFLEVDEEKIEEARVAALDVRSLDYSVDEELPEFYNSVAAFDTETTPDILDLRSEIAKLPEEEKSLIIARYYEDMTQSEASRELGISQVQVSRKEGKILEKLRVAL